MHTPVPITSDEVQPFLAFPHQRFDLLAREPWRNFCPVFSHNDLSLSDVKAQDFIIRVLFILDGLLSLRGSAGYLLSDFGRSDLVTRKPWLFTLGFWTLCSCCAEALAFLFESRTLCSCCAEALVVYFSVALCLESLLSFTREPCPNLNSINLPVNTPPHGSSQA